MGELAEIFLVFPVFFLSNQSDGMDGNESKWDGYGMDMGSIWNENGMEMDWISWECFMF